MSGDEGGFLVGLVIGVIIAALVFVNVNSSAEFMYTKLKTGEEYCATHNGLQSYDWNSWECKDGIEVSGVKSK